MPKVSVSIPSHNSECWLADAVESIIDQTFKDWEIVVVDDGSTDTTNVLLDYYSGILGDKFIYKFVNESEGIARTRNLANSLARGEIIVVQDSDDISQKDRLKATWKYFQRHKDVDLIYGSYQYMDVLGKPIQEERSKPFDFNTWKDHNHICHTTVAYRKKAIREIPYREDMKVLDDLFMYFDFHKAGKKIENIDDVLAFRRIRPSSISYTKEELIQKKRDQFKEETDAYIRSLGR